MLSVNYTQKKQNTFYFFTSLFFKKCSSFAAHVLALMNQNTNARMAQALTHIHAHHTPHTHLHVLNVICKEAHQENGQR